MKQFFTVFKFELMHYFKNKAYIITTSLLCVVAVIGLSVPTILNLVGFGEDKEPTGPSSSETSDFDTYGVITNDIIDLNDPSLTIYFPSINFIEYTSPEQLNEDVIGETIEAGFVIESDFEFQYLVKNSSMHDSLVSKFSNYLKHNYQLVTFESLNIDSDKVFEVLNTKVSSETIVLGKDSVNNYMYTYILIMMLYFMVIFYGQMIATGVASEKSNRAIEVLVTSAKPNNLIFGKVFAGALAGIIQFGAIIGFSYISYEINSAAWNNGLDMIFHIPLDAILSFAVFGLLGYLFYSFIFGALGALASKTEDINTSAMPITLIFVGAFFVVMAGMNDPTGSMLTIASYIPFSSFMAMFVRVAMTDVSMVEVIISLVILVLSTGLIGIIAAKIYRQGTLRYGNPLKLKDAFKMLKSKD